MTFNKMKKMLAVGLLTGAALASQAAIVNGSFELGNGADASNWIRFGNAYREMDTSSVDVSRTGSHSMKMFGNFSGGFNVTGAFQNFAIAPGQSATAKGYGMTLSGDKMSGGNWALLKLIYRDAGDNDLAFSESLFINANTTPDVWHELTMSLGPAPAGTAKGSLFMLFLQPEFAGGSAFFDDLEVNVVPEPATMTALAIGVGCMLRKRRK